MSVLEVLASSEGKDKWWGEWAKHRGLNGEKGVKMGGGR